MAKKKGDLLNSWTRAAVILITLGAVCYLAILGNAQIAPLAAGALFTVLASAMAYEFRGRIQGTAEPSSDAETVTGDQPLLTRRPPVIARSSASAPGTEPPVRAEPPGAVG